MENIKTKILKVGEKFKQSEDVDRKLRSDLKKIINSLFCELEIEADCLNNFYYRNETLFLRARNKTIANELFLRKEQIKNALALNNKIKNVIIR